MNKRVEGSYTTVEAAMRAVERLRDEGYGRNDIYVIANSNVRDSIPFTMDAEVTTDADMRDKETGDNRSLWEKIKDAFTIDEYDTDRYDSADYNPESDPLHQYHDDIERGNVLVLVDDDASQAMSNRDTALGDDTAARTTDPSSSSTLTDTTTPMDPIGMDSGLGTPGADTSTGPMMGGDSIVDDNDYVTPDRKTDPPLTGDTREDVSMTDTHLHTDADLDDDEKIRLREEHLEVGTNEVQTGEVKIGKHVTEETQSVDVPVTHEEVTIERHPVTDGRTTDEPITNVDETDEIVVPVTEEQVDVNKHTEVVEEVDIHKDKVTDHKTVSDTVRKEELDVDTEGHVDVTDTDDVTTDHSTNDDHLNRPL